MNHSVSCSIILSSASRPPITPALLRTSFTLDWISEPELRRETGHELNKGEARNSLARAVFIHRLGEIRDRT
jgi:TnpA family transposase